MSKIYVVGMGPGKENRMTCEALEVLDKSDVIIGYTKYIDLLPERYLNKEVLSTTMKQEVERCELCIEKARENKTVSLICSGDAGIYGMASLMIEIAGETADIEVEIVAGITAASSGAALLGAPIGHDFCVISLSDLLTPWELIEKRLVCAAKGDFCIVLYNPSSHKRADYLQKACEIILRNSEPLRVCGVAENIGREDENTRLCSLAELKDMQVNMFTTVFIGNSQTRIVNGKMVTPRGYVF